MCYYNNCTGLASSILSRSISLSRDYRNVFTSRSIVISLGTMTPKYYNMAIAAAIDVTIATDGLIGCLATAVAFTIAFVFPLQCETALSSLIRSDDLIIEAQAVTNEQYHRVHFDDTIDGAIVYRSKSVSKLFSNLKRFQLSTFLSNTNAFRTRRSALFISLDSWLTMAKSFSLFVSNPSCCALRIKGGCCRSDLPSYLSYIRMVYRTYVRTIIHTYDVSYTHSD